MTLHTPPIPDETPLQMALRKAERSEIYENELRDALLYAVETAELPELIGLGRKLDEFWDSVVRSVQPNPKQLPASTQETKRKRKVNRTK